MTAQIPSFCIPVFEVDFFRKIISAGLRTRLLFTKFHKMIMAMYLDLFNKCVSVHVSYKVN